MKRTPISYTQKRLTKLKSHLKKFNKTKDPERLHQARVEIKRIKAVLGLIQFHDKNFDAHKAYVPFRNIFRACLAIREQAVTQALNQTLARGSTRGKTINRKAIDSFLGKIPEFIKTVEKKGKPVTKEINKVSKKGVQNHLKSKQEILKNKLYPSFHSKDLHKTRKLVKEVIFLEAMALQKEKRNYFYVEVAKLMGDWHDRLVYVDRLKKKQRPPVKKINTLQSQNRTTLRLLRKMVKEHYAQR